MRVRKPRIRVTEIGLGIRCPLQLYFLRTVGPRPPSGAATTGTAFHKAMEVNFKEKAAIGIEAPLDVCTDAFNDEFKRRLLDTNWENMKPNDMLKKGIGMVKQAKKEMTPPIEVASEEDVERWFLIDCGDFEISGTVDLLLPENSRTIDWKTGRNMWYQARADKEVQGFLYPMGITPVDLELIPHSFNVVTYAGKTGDFPVSHSRESAEYLVRTARRLVKMIERNEEPNPGLFQMLCSEKWCAWRHLCPLFKKGRS